MEVIYQKNSRRLRAEGDLAALFLSFDTVCFEGNEGSYRLANETVTRLAEGFSRYAMQHLRVSESRQNGARHPIYASFAVTVHRADPKLICLEAVCRADRFHRVIFQKHLLLHFDRCGTRAVNSRALVGKRGKWLTVHENQATDKDGTVYSIKEKYRNKK